MASTSSTPAFAMGEALPRRDATKAESRESNRGVSEAEEQRGPSGEQLSEEEQKQVDELQKRDREVRTHEQAHVAAAGALFRGGPYYTYQSGPDGKQYAVGGSVKIDTSEGRTPEETVQKAAKMRAAALAPAEPSSTDRAVAAKASRMEAEARREIAEESAAETSGEADETGSASETQGIERASTDTNTNTPDSAEPGVDPKKLSPPKVSDAAASTLGGAIDTFA